MTTLRAAVYARKSQPGEDAIERQVENARAFALKHGWVLADSNIFADDGVSGAEFNDRPQFSAMMAGAKAKPRRFDVLITMAPDRVGRDQFRTNLALLEIVEHKVRVFFYSDGAELKLNTPIAKIMLGMQNFAGEDYRQTIANKTREALIERAQKGWATGTRVFGYDYIRVGGPHGPERCTADRKCPCHVERVINDDEKKIVERVFTLSAEGHGDLKIANILSGENVPAPGKKGWAKGVVRLMLSNKLYIGIATFGRSKSIATGGNAYEREAGEAVETKVPQCRIISDELWSAVQARRAKTRAAYLRAPNGHLLSKPERGTVARFTLNGFARCHACQGPLAFVRKNPRTMSYYCRNHTVRGGGSCKNGKGIPVSLLDRAVLAKLDETLSDPEVVWSLLTERAARWRREHARPASEKLNTEKAITKLEAEVARLVNALADGKASSDITNAITDRRVKIEGYKAVLAEPEPVPNREDFDAMLAENRAWLTYHGPVTNEYDPVGVRSALRRIGVEQIIVIPDGPDAWTFTGFADLGHVTRGVNRSSGEQRRSPRSPTKNSRTAGRPPAASSRAAPRIEPGSRFRRASRSARAPRGRRAAG